MVLALIVQATDAAHSEGVLETFGVDWPHLTAQLISFAIVCALLYRFAYQPILRMLDERRRQIAMGQANTEKINATLAGIEQQRQAVIDGAQREATQLIADARDAAARLRQQELQRATADGEDVLRQMREAATMEQARLRAELRHEIGRLVVETSAAVVGRVLTPDDERRLAEATARQLGAA